MADKEMHQFDKNSIFMPPTNRAGRFRILAVTPEAFLSLFAEDNQYRVVQSFIPNDAYVVDVFFHISKAPAGGDRYIGVLVESDAFEMIADGDLIPLLPPCRVEKI